MLYDSQSTECRNKEEKKLNFIRETIPFQSADHKFVVVFAAGCASHKALASCFCVPFYHFIVLFSPGGD